MAFSSRRKYLLFQFLIWGKRKETFGHFKSSVTVALLDPVNWHVRADVATCSSNWQTTPVSTHHGSLLDAVAWLDDSVLLSRPAQEVRQLAVRTMHGFTFCSLGTVTTFMLKDIGNVKYNSKLPMTWALFQQQYIVKPTKTSWTMSTCVWVTMGTPPMISVL